MNSNADIERKGTFVGTVNYLAPEMIKDQESSLATDMWALGCIIFKMYTGKVPFPGMSETACFPMILQRKIVWPHNIEMNPVLVDLIDCLLQVDPLDRLGCPETPQDIRRLMRHRFFKGINFKTDLAQSTDVRKALADSEIEIITKQVEKLNYIQTQPTNPVISKNGQPKIELDQNP